MTAPWVVLDRDGVINVDRVDYVKNMEEWHSIPGSIEAIARLCKAGYNVAVATNQSGIGRGIYTVEDMQILHEYLDNEVEACGGIIAGIFYCPHTPEDNCVCRKPKAGLLDEIEAQFGISLVGVPFVGDAVRDLEAAHSKGCLSVLVRTGKGNATHEQVCQDPRFQNIPIYDDLATYVEHLLVDVKDGN